MRINRMRIFRPLCSNLWALASLCNTIFLGLRCMMCSPAESNNRNTQRAVVTRQSNNYFVVVTAINQQKKLQHRSIILNNFVK